MCPLTPVKLMRENIAFFEDVLFNILSGTFGTKIKILSAYSRRKINDDLLSCPITEDNVAG